MESKSSFRFFSKSFLIILLVLFLSSFISAWTFLECFLCPKDVPVIKGLQKKPVLNKPSFSSADLKLPTVKNFPETISDPQNDIPSNPVIEPVSEPVNKPVSEPVTESVSESTSEPIAQESQEKYSLLSESFKKELIQQINKGECLENYLKLQTNAKTLADKQLLKRLAPFCLETHAPVLQVFEKSFLKAEKGALIEYHKQTHTGFEQKIKILLTYLIHIRKEHPSSEEVPDLLNNNI